MKDFSSSIMNFKFPEYKYPEKKKNQAQLISDEHFLAHVFLIVMNESK